MKISRIFTRGFCGLHALELEVHAPLLLFAGHNGAGKSSAAEAVRFALSQAQSTRIGAVKKSDYAALISDGFKHSEVSVEIEGHPRGAGFAAIIDKDGPDFATLADTPGLVTGFDYMPHVTESYWFASISENARRNVLFELMDVQTTPEAVERALLSRGVAPDYASQAAAMMRGGFQGAASYADEAARDARAAWRVVTGEAYGSKKAATWTAPDGGFDAGLLQTYVKRLEDLTPEVEAANREVIALEEHEKQRERNAATVADMRSKLLKRGAVAAQLEADEEEFEGVEQRLRALQVAVAAPRPSEPLSCPHCGALSRLEGGELKPYRGVVTPLTHPPQVENVAPLVTLRTQLSRKIDQGRQALNEADAAASVIASLEALAPVDPEAISGARECMAKLKETYAYISQQRRELENAQRKHAEAVKKTLDAAEHHAHAVAWSRVAELLSPEGIPSELLQAAIQPFNTCLREFAAATGWYQVSLDADMQIRANGRPYVLLSESEKWRADAMLAVAIAHYSELRFVMLDRFDVLDLGHRTACIDWMAELFEKGVLEQALIFGTMRAAPDDEPGFMQVVWLRDGVALHKGERDGKREQVA